MLEESILQSLGISSVLCFIFKPGGGGGSQACISVAHVCVCVWSVLSDSLCPHGL